MHRKFHVATSAVFFSKYWVPRYPELVWLEFKRKPELTYALGRVGCSLKIPANKRWKWLLRWALWKSLPRRKKKKAAARKKDILRRMSKSRSKTHLPNFESKKWGFHVRSRIEKLLYPANLHGKSFEPTSGCLLSKGLVTFPALYPALYGSRDHSNSPDGCHQHVQHVKEHKAEGQKST